MKLLEGGETDRGVHVGSDFLHSRLSFFYNRNLPSCTLSLFSLTSSVLIPDPVKSLHGVVSVKSTHVLFMTLPVNCMEPQLNMISASKSGTDYVVFNVIVDSGCSSHAFNCLNYVEERTIRPWS